MKSHTYRVFEIERSYYTTALEGDILARSALTITDDDNRLDNRLASDAGGNQTFEFADQPPVESYSIGYLDYAQVGGGGPEFELYTMKVAFEDGSTKYYVMSKNSGFDPVVGDNVAVTDYSTFEAVTLEELEQTTGICFTPGTRIAVPGGETPVERLRIGDPVLTADAGPQPVRWIGSRVISAATLRHRPRLGPVCLPAGQFGNVRPLLLSPQHRLLCHAGAPATRALPAQTMISARHAQRFLRAGALAPTPRGVLYIHLLFDAHHVIWAEGAACESLFLGPVGWRGIAGRGRAEISTLMPDLVPTHTPAMRPARPFLLGRDIRAICADASRAA